MLSCNPAGVRDRRVNERDRGREMCRGRREGEKQKHKERLLSLSPPRSKERVKITLFLFDDGEEKKTLSLSFLVQQHGRSCPRHGGQAAARHHSSSSSCDDDNGGAHALGVGTGVAESSSGRGCRVDNVVCGNAQEGRCRPSSRRSRFFLFFATAATAAARLLPHLSGLRRGGPDRPVPVPR